MSFIIYFLQRNLPTCNCGKFVSDTTLQMLTLRPATTLISSHRRHPLTAITTSNTVIPLSNSIHLQQFQNLSIMHYS